MANYLRMPWSVATYAAPEGKSLSGWITDYLTIVRSGRFDAPYYSKMRGHKSLFPAFDYLRKGVGLGLRPRSDFDPAGYLCAYGDVRASRQDPFAHYLRNGHAEDRLTTFDAIGQVQDLNVKPQQIVRLGEVLANRMVTIVTLTADGGFAVPPSNWGAGEYFLFGYENAYVPANLMEVLAPFLTDRPALLYGDDIGRDPATGQIRFFRKPAFNAALFEGDDYIATPLIVRRDLLKTYWRSVEDLSRIGLASLYELCWLAADKGVLPTQIPAVLLADRFGRLKLGDTVRQQIAARLTGGRTISSTEDFPEVTLVIPTMQATAANSGAPLIVSLLQSLTSTNYPVEKITVLVGDDVDNPQIYAPFFGRLNIKVISTPRTASEPFNYARKMNVLIKHVCTQSVVVMNDDLEIKNPDWLKALQNWANRSGVGGVGGRLYYPDGTLQHAGVFADLDRGPLHLWQGDKDGRDYAGWDPAISRDVGMVTGAVFATTCSLIDRIGGFDEDLTLEWNDLDMCLRLRQLGLRIIYCAEAELWHNERMSRRENQSADEEKQLFLERWQGYLSNDPAFHPCLRVIGTGTFSIDDNVRWYESVLMEDNL